MEDVLRSYLISLGFEVDNAAYNKLKDTLQKLNELTAAKTESMTASYVKASTLIVSSLSVIGFATVDLLDKISQADLGYQKFAMRMYMARDAAKEFKIVTDAMGESLHDIAWMPELTARYRTLMGEARGMALPSDAEGQLKYLRDIRFEFTRLKVEATYGMQQVGYYLFKYLIEPIAGTKLGMKEINDWIQAKLPEIANKIAFWLSRLFTLAKSAGWAIKELFDTFKKLWDMLPAWGQALLAFGAIVKLVFMAGPIGRALIVLNGLIFLIDDFYHHLKGEDNTLGPIWDAIDKKVEKISKGIYLALVYGGAMKDMFVMSKADWNFKYENGAALKGERVTKNYEEAMENAADKASKSPAGAPMTAEGLGGVGMLVPSESGGNIHALGQYIPGRGQAYGKYQIMPANMNSLLKQAGINLRWSPGMELSEEIQDKTAQVEWLRLMKKYDNREDLGVAAWYGGEGVANRLQRGELDALNIGPPKGIKGPTIGQKIKMVTGHDFYPFMPGIEDIKRGQGEVNNQNVVTFNIYNPQEKDVDRILRRIDELQGAEASMKIIENDN